MKFKQLIGLIIVSLLIVLFGWQWVIELQAEEPRRAIVTIEMILSGNYIVPQINGWAYYNKPPVFNWLMAAFFWLFGSFGEWVVRMPSLVSFVLLGWINYKIVKPRLGREIALLSSLFLLTAGDILFYGAMNSGEIDLFYALVVYLQVMVIFIYWEKKQFLKMFLLSYLLTAIGFLTKGLPSLAFQAITLLAWAIYNRRFWILLGWKHLSGIVFFTAVCIAYFYPYSLQEDVVTFLVRQFKEASQRTGLETELSDTLIQLISFPLQSVRLLIPWSLLAVFFFKKGFWQKLKFNRLLTFSALFFIANIPIYWFSGEFKARYLYMFLPFLSIFLAYYYQENREIMPLINRITSRFFDAVVIVFPFLFVSLLFIPQTVELDLNWLRVIVMLLLGSGLIYLHFRSAYKIYTFILLMVLARLGFNLFYLPALQNDQNVMYYREAMAEIFEITGNEPVYLYGKPHVFRSDASIGPLTFEEVELKTAPLHAYQISYYISKNNGYILQFEEKIKPGRFYIAKEEDIRGKGYTVLHPFEDRWKKCRMVLFRS